MFISKPGRELSDVTAPPPAPRRERKRQQLADHVAGTAFRLFEDLGYEAVTMEQVAAAADVAKGTLYKYFPVKEALLAHHFQRDIASGINALWQILAKQRSFAAQMRCLLHASAKWHEARRKFIAHYVRYQLANFDGGDKARQRRASAARSILERLCSDGQARGDVRRDLPAAQLAVMLECMSLGATMVWLGTADGNLKTEFDALLRVAMSGVGT
jgi:AcrR family transcriptional regulator